MRVRVWIKSGLIGSIALVVAAIASGVCASAVSAEAVGWHGKTAVIMNQSSSSHPVSLRHTCHEQLRLIAVRGWAQPKEACVYGGGGGVQVARYEGAQGDLYAVAFPLDEMFSSLRNPCAGYVTCYYSQPHDRLITVAGGSSFQVHIYSNFSKALQRHSGLDPFYDVSTSLPYVTLMRGSQPLKAKATTLAPSGDWAAIEVIEYGFIRLNLSTLEYKRVIAPGATYGNGFNPAFELAITSDGSHIAVAGFRAGIDIYDIDAQCGDTLTDESTVLFSQYVYPCPSNKVPVGQLFPGFITAYTPYFVTGGTRLMTEIVTSSAGPQIVTRTLLGVDGEWLGVSDGYSALGDSFTSGEGETSDNFYLTGTNTPQNHCHVSIRSYPYLAGNYWGLSTTNYACSGARIDDVLLSQLPAVQGASSDHPGYITVGVGGNDLALMDKLKTCLGPGECEWISPEKREATAREIKALFPRLTNLIKEIRVAHPLSSIAVVGYPRVINTAANAQCGVTVGMLLSSEEREYMDQSIHYLNRVLRAAANQSKAPYVDIENALVGERLCDPSSSAMNSLRFGDDIAPLPALGAVKVIGAESFHPTPRGHQLIATAITNFYSAAPTGCDACEFSAAMLEPPAYWNRGTVSTGDGQTTNGDQSTPSFIQRAARFLSQLSAPIGARLTINVPAGFLQPGSRGSIELHSSPQALTEVEASTDGSLQAEVTLPSSEVGYHTVHVLGVSSGGDPLDLYQVIAVGDVSKTLPVNSPEEPSVPSAPLPIVTTPGTTTQDPTHRPSVSHRSVTTTTAVLPSAFGATTQTQEASVPPSQISQEPQEVLGAQKSMYLSSTGSPAVIPKIPSRLSITVGVIFLLVATIVVWVVFRQVKPPRS